MSRWTNAQQTLRVGRYASKLYLLSPAPVNQISRAREAHVCSWDLCYYVSPLANEFVIARLLFIPRNESFNRIFLLLIAPE